MESLTTFFQSPLPPALCLLLHVPVPPVCPAQGVTGAGQAGGVGLLLQRGMKGSGIAITGLCALPGTLCWLIQPHTPPGDACAPAWSMGQESLVGCSEQAHRFIVLPNLVCLLSPSFSFPSSLPPKCSMAEVPLSLGCRLGAFLGYPNSSPSLFPPPPPLPLKGQHEPFLAGICLLDAVLGAGTGSSLQPGCLLHSWGFLWILRVTSQVIGTMLSWGDVGTFFVLPVMCGGWARGTALQSGRPDTSPLLKTQQDVYMMDSGW